VIDSVFVSLEQQDGPVEETAGKTSALFTELVRV